MDGSSASSDQLLNDWMTRSELAAALGVSVPTLRRWESEGIGPPFTYLGRRILYRKESFREWLRTKERASATSPQSR